jgi:predicted permease
MKRLEDEMFQDLRFGVRMLLKRPGVTAVVVTSLALGIGANTTIFSFVNALLLRPPDVEAPRQLLEIWNQKQRANSDFERYLPMNYPDYIQYRDHNRAFSELLAYDGDPRMVSWSRAGQAELAQGQIVSGNFFSVLGVNAAIGRSFLPEEDRVVGERPVIVLSHAFWRQRLNADPNVVGTTLTLNGAGFSVIGVAPPSFKGIMAGIAPDFWAPMAMAPQISHDPELLSRRSVSWLLMIGRLRSGVDSKAALADLNLIARQIQQADPKNNPGSDMAAFPVTMVPGPVRGYVGAFTGVLMAVVGLTLLIACANAANLLLALSSSRRQEMAVRAALGASKGRLIRQSLTESVALACLGGAAGLGLAYWTAQLLLKLTPPTLPIKLDIPMDYRVFGFTLIASIMTGIVFGLAPAIRGARFELTPVLKDAGYGRGYHRSRFRNALIIGQVAVCVVLLIAGGLCLRSLFNAQSIDIGFETRDRLAATIDLKNLDYPKARGRAFFKSWIDSVRNLPGAQGVSIANYMPLESTSLSAIVNIEGHQPPAGENGFGINMMTVGPDYFGAMGIPLLRGREFGERDDEAAPPVAIINEAMANRFWPGPNAAENAMGRQLIIGDMASGRRHEIIGVVKTGKYRTLSEDARPFFYAPFFQDYQNKATLVAHISGAEQSLAAVRGEAFKLDPHLALTELGTVEQRLLLALFPPRVAGILLGVLGLLGLGLALVGLSGAIAYSVSQRTREIGVRMALGAQQRDVLRLVLRQGVALTLFGLGLGIAASLVLTRFLESLLYGVSATDPATFVGVSALLLVVASLACYFPARRAANVAPLEALRYE